MRNPRDVWTTEELEAINQRAIKHMDLFAKMGDYVSYETCWDLAQLGLMQKKLNEIKKFLFDGQGK